MTDHPNQPESGAVEREKIARIIDPDARPWAEDCRYETVVKWDAAIAKADLILIALADTRTEVVEPEGAHAGMVGVPGGSFAEGRETIYPAGMVEALKRAIKAMDGVTVFVTSRQRIKAPEGEDWWANEIANARLALHAAPEAAQPVQAEGVGALIAEARAYAQYLRQERASPPRPANGVNDLLDRLADALSRSTSPLQDGSED